MLWGFRGRSTAPGPDLLGMHLASCAASAGHGSLACALSQMTTQANRRRAGPRQGRK
jgi:hypothetical protein